MNDLKKLHYSVVAWILIFILISSGFLPKVSVASSMPKFSKKKMVLYVGEKHVISIKNISNSAKVTWRTSNKKVASIIKNRSKRNTSKVYVKAQKKGTAQITATYKSSSSNSFSKKTILKCKLTIKNKTHKNKQITKYDSFYSVNQYGQRVIDEKLDSPISYVGLSTSPQPPDTVCVAPDYSLEQNVLIHTSCSNEYIFEKQIYSSDAVTKNDEPIDTPDAGAKNDEPKDTPDAGANNIAPTFAPKNKNDISCLKSIIAIQKKQNPEVLISEDINADCYTWDNNGRLTKIYWKNKGLTGDISFNGLSGLELLDCSYNQLVSLDVSENKSLLKLYCQNNNISSLDVFNNIKLEYLLCYNNELSTLNIQNNGDLLLVDCDYNNISSLNTNNNLKLNTLLCRDNDLSALDVSANTQLKTLDCGNNEKIKIVYTTNNPLLKSIITDDNVFLSGINLDLIPSASGKNKSDLIILNSIIEKQILRGADIDTDFDSNCYKWNNNGRLIEIYWNKSNLSGDISFEGLTEIKIISCISNYITKLNVNNLNKLEILYCFHNYISKLDFSKLNSLRSLDCGRNYFVVDCVGVGNFFYVPS